jgi:hypothetical protein
MPVPERPGGPAPGVGIPNVKMLQVPTKSGGCPKVREKKILAAGVAIPAARLNDDDGACIRASAGFFNSAAIWSIQTHNKDGDHGHVKLYFDPHTF